MHSPAKAGVVPSAVFQLGEVYYPAHAGVLSSGGVLSSNCWCTFLEVHSPAKAGVPSIGPSRHPRMARGINPRLPPTKLGFWGLGPSLGGLTETEKPQSCGAPTPEVHFPAPLVVCYPSDRPLAKGSAVRPWQRACIRDHCLATGCRTGFSP